MPFMPRIMSPFGRTAYAVGVSAPEEGIFVTGTVIVKARSGGHETERRLAVVVHERLGRGILTAPCRCYHHLS